MLLPQLEALELDPKRVADPIDQERWLELSAVVVRYPNPKGQRRRRRHPNCWLELLLLALRCPMPSVMGLLPVQLQLALTMLPELPVLSPILMGQRLGFEPVLEMH